jgi:tryptophan synthase beta chain
MDTRRLAALAVVTAAVVFGSAPMWAQSPPPAAPASPSAPPFWARPKPSAPNCACDNAPSAVLAPAGRSGLWTGLLAGGGVVLLFLLARRFMRKPEAEPRARLAAAVAVPAPAAVSADSSMPAGFDPRARLSARQPAKAEPAATTATAASPAPDFAFGDLRTTPVELAQDEPAAESDRAIEFYSEVAYSLLDALHKEPDRQDLRFKLLEIYFARKQISEFVTLAYEYLERNRGYRDAAWREIASMGVRLTPEHPLFGGGAPTDAPRPVRRVHQMRRFNERDIDQGRMFAAQQALAADFERLRAEAPFRAALRQTLADAVRRPSPLTASAELAHVADVARIFVKHEDRRRFHDDLMLNVFGQMLVAQRLGRTRVVTATRDGNLGHVVASAAARFGLECMVYITERDLNHYYARVLSMRRLGAILRPIPGNADQEQPDPRRAALEAWLNDPATTQYVSGLTGGPAPYPEMVREFLSVIGRETAEQMQETTGGLPHAVVMAASDGHLGLGLLEGLLEHGAVKLYCVEQKKPGEAPPEAAPEPTPGGVPAPQPLLRREHRWLRDTGRIEYVEGDDHETLRIVEQFHARGTTLFTDSARALAQARVLARQMDPKQSVVVLLSNQEGADFRNTGSDW